MIDDQLRRAYPGAEKFRVIVNKYTLLALRNYFTSKRLYTACSMLLSEVIVPTDSPRLEPGTSGVRVQRLDSYTIASLTTISSSYLHPLHESPTTIFNLFFIVVIIYRPHLLTPRSGRQVRESGA